MLEAVWVIHGTGESWKETMEGVKISKGALLEGLLITPRTQLSEGPIDRIRLIYQHG